MRKVLAYGAKPFPKGSITDGVITNHEVIAKTIKELFNDGLIGTISTDRVVARIPVARTYNRILSLPASLSSGDIASAVRLEAEQYIPIPYEQLYIDYEVLPTTNKPAPKKAQDTQKEAKDDKTAEPEKTEKTMEVLLTAVPRTLVDSYMQLFDILGLQTIGLETSLSATGRLVTHAETQDVPTMLIDFGSLSMDLSVFDQGAVQVTGTVSGGGDNFSDVIAGALGVTHQQAHLIKIHYGINRSKKQKEILGALQPSMQQLTRELRKMMRFYKERSESNQEINQIITIGGGANMPGLSEYLVNELRMPVRMCDTWRNLDFAHLQPPHDSEKSTYATVAGLALVNPKEMVA